MGRQTGVVLYVLALAAVVVGVDVLTLTPSRNKGSWRPLDFAG
jgi:hypothetical protein